MARTTSSNPSQPRFSFSAARARRNRRNVPLPNPPQPPTRLSRVYDSIRETFYSLVERSVDFRTTDSLPILFETFTDSSTVLDYLLWYGFKFMFLGCGGIAIGTVCHCIWAYLFGAKEFLVVELCFAAIILGFYFVLCLNLFIKEYLFFKLRIPVIGLLSLDLQILSRSTKTIMIFVYTYHNWEEKLGHHVKWGSAIVWFASFFSLSSISMLAMFRHEFAHSRTLMDDFIIVLIPLCLTQYFINKSVINAVLYLIPLVVAAISGYGIRRHLYRPHRSREAYVPWEPVKEEWMQVWA